MPNKDFLKLNAYSIKELINRKLAEDTNFTDQIYPGSNLAVLVDIFSYMAQLMLYGLNNAASESMFSDTELYENMNRLCKFLGYNPKGMSPSTVNCKLSWSGTDKNLDRFILPYSYVKTGKTDSNGNEVCYSIPSDENIVNNSMWEIESTTVAEDGVTEIYNFSKNLTLYNGKWKLYDQVFVSDGTSWQTFVLDSIGSSFSNGQFVANEFFDVYVVDGSEDTSATTNQSKVYKFKQSSFQLFKNPFKINSTNNVIANDGFYNTQDFLFSGNLSDSNGRIFNLRLNENKNYEISFGDGTSGAIPPKGSLIYIVYLDTNGLDGVIDVNDIDTNSFEVNTVGLRQDILNSIWFTGAISPDNIFGTDGEDDHIRNTTVSTVASLEESVDEIRENAPNWFKIGNRLVTKSDYEYFIKSHPAFTNQFSDITCMSNWDYIGTFFKWLYSLGKTKSAERDSRKYLNQNRLIKSDYVIADAADANNIYLWYAPSNSMVKENRTADTKKAIFQNITNVIAPIKDITHEPIVVPGIPVRFELCAAPESVVQTWITEGGTDGFVSNNTGTTYLEVTLSDGTLYSPTNVYSAIVEKIMTYFTEISGGKFGVTVNYGDLTNKILTEISGITKIRTIFKPGDSTSNIIVYNGISMASWSTNVSGLIDEGIDCEVGMSGRLLEKFQYAYFDNISAAKLLSQIKVIKTSSAVMSSHLAV